MPERGGRPDRFVQVISAQWAFESLRKEAFIASRRSSADSCARRKREILQSKALGVKPKDVREAILQTCQFLL